MPLNETSQLLLCISLPSQQGPPFSFRRSSYMNDTVMHLLSPLLPRPSAPNLFGLLCYLCHERCHHRPWNPSQKLMGHASYHCLPWAFHRISDQPPVALWCHWLLSLSPDSITTALLSTLADSLCLQPCIFWYVYITNVTMLFPA